jgi:hypothetical protein
VPGWLFGQQTQVVEHGAGELVEVDLGVEVGGKSARPAPSGCPCPGMEAMMASHFAILREAMWMSPSTSLFWAHLCAAT